MTGDGAFAGTAGKLEYQPSAAGSLIGACFELVRGLEGGTRTIRSLTRVAASGAFKSGVKADERLSDVGKIAFEAINRMMKDANDAKEAARQAGLKLVDQDEQNGAHLRRSLEAPDGKDPLKIDLPFGIMSGNPPPKVELPSQLKTPVKPPGEPAAGMFPMNVPPESGSNFILDAAYEALDPALPESMHTLAMQWLQLSNSLKLALATFDHQYSSVLGTPLFSGDAANQMRAALSDFSSSGKRVAMEAQTNSAAIAMWAQYMGQSKSKIELLRTERDNAVTTAQPENKLTLARRYDELSMTQLQTTWNLPLAMLNRAVANISDPTSPVAGTPLFLPGMGPRPNAPSGSSTNLPGSSSTGSSSSSSSAGPSSGAGSGGTKSPGSGGDPAAGLKRAGSGDPVSGADKAAAQSGSGSGNPASAAQSAAPKAGDSGRGLGGSSAATKSSGVGPGSAAAEAAKKAALESAKSAGAGGGKGAGGGGGGGLGGGVGKLGAAGPEGSLSARASAGISAAERGIAAEQAATRATPAGTSGAPMGGRGAAGAGAPGGESEGKHKSARYLQSEENGEEIVGDLPEVAPQVLGGLNLDTTDDTKSASDTTNR